MGYENSSRAISPPVRCDPATWRAMLGDARADPAVERCGLLVGVRDAAGETVTGHVPARNVAADPARHFELDPAVLIAALCYERDGGPAVIGHYHSHPAGQAAPSATDLAASADDGRLWLIVTADDARAWRRVGDAFVPVAVQVG